MMTKIKTWDELEQTLVDTRKLGKKIGFTNGCFDVLHVGHVKYLQAAKDQCDVLVVGVNSDDSVRRLKGESRPINGELPRMQVLEALGCVDLIAMFDEDTPAELIHLLTPDVLFKGGDWTEDSVVGAQHVKDNGGNVVIIPYVDGFSTTGTINKIKEDHE